ncbi:hypothetical protein ACEPU1_32105 [Pseudomonas aeruginosa]
MKKEQGGYLVPLLYLIALATLVGVFYGVWLISGWISGLILGADLQEREGPLRFFIAMAVLGALSMALTTFNYFVITVPREKRRARFWELK